MASLGAAFTLCLIITQSAAKTIIVQLQQPLSPKMARFMQEAIPGINGFRMLFSQFKLALVRTIKFYRSMKPEIKLATCFSRYAGIIQGRSYQLHSQERAIKIRPTKKPKEEKNEVTIQKFLRDIVSAMMLFMNDLMPQPMSSMMKMAMGMWKTTQDMYKAVNKDEMGKCSLEYMSKRFWWWLAI